MASIVLRRDGRAEIRESYSTPRGPRSRTLAVFRELTDRDLEKAERRASRPFHRARILARARALGVPRFGESASRAARALLAELQLGRPLAPTLVTALREALARHPATELPASIGPTRPWLAASDEERGKALRERMHPWPSGGPGPAKDTPYDEKVALLAGSLERAHIAHAFGGVLALGYYAPSGAVGPIESGSAALLGHTQLFVFEEARRMGRVLTALARLGIELDRAATANQLRESGTATLQWGLAAIELSCAGDPHHDACRRRIRRVPFGEGEIWILSAEDLLVLLAAAGLGSDPAGVTRPLAVAPVDAMEQLLFARVGDLDLEYVRDWLDRIAGPEDVRPKRRPVPGADGAGQRLRRGLEARQRFEDTARRMLGDNYLFFGTTLTCHIDAAKDWVVSQVFALPGLVPIPDPDTEAFERLARGVAEGPLVKRAPVRDETARLAGLHAGTYTVVASGYELSDPRHRTMKSETLTLELGVETATLHFRF